MESAMPTVLIVEDEPLIAAIYTAVLRRLPYHVETAHSKQSALTKIQKLAPNLILLDLLIPLGVGEDLVEYSHPVGFDILEWVRHHPQYAHAKVIVLTNLDADLHEKHARALGADEYLVKANLDPLAVADRVAAHLRSS